jgi:UPF0716 protein FxsA
MLFPLLALAFFIVPILELAVILFVGHEIGVLPTIALLVLSGVVGGWLARREGIGAWRRFQKALNEIRVPTTEIIDGAMVLLAGALMLAPGFLTDILGILLLLPPTRAVLRRLVVAEVTRRAAKRMGGDPGRGRTRARRPRIIDADSALGRRRGSGTTATWGDPEHDDEPVNPPGERF